MKWLEMILFIWLSFMAKILGFGIFIGVFVIDYIVSNGIQKGNVITIYELLALVAMSIFLLWVSLRLLIYGDELSKRY